MNKIYKVIWSHVKQCYVVTSELTKSQHKSSSKSELISTNVHQRRCFGKAAVAAIVAGLLTFGSYGLADAAGPAATENGPASKADGIASIAVGVGDQVVANKGKMYQGATAIAAGTLNVIDAAAEVNFDGVANSVIGQVNYTKNANAAVIMGAGNKVTNSYKDVKLDGKTLQALMQAYQQNNMQKVTEILQKAVPNSGGQVMVMGGGNTVDYAQSSQVMGVSNILKGTKDSISTYNLVDGFQNKVTNSQNTYVVGTNNSFVNMANSIVLGDNNNRIANNTDRIMKDTIVIGDGNTVQNGDESIAIGKNITIQRDGGNGYEYDTGNVAIGSNAYISSYVNQGDSIAIGKNASVINMNGSLEQAFAFGRPMGKEYSGSIAIGQNSYARSGSTMIGIHDYQGTIGDLEVNFTKGKSAGSSGIGNYQESIDATTIGNNSYNNGVFSTVVGSYTAVSGLYHNQKWGEKPYGVQNFGAAVLGSLNSVEGLSSTEHNTAGMADSILGSANRTKNANGTVMVGAGNVVTNSINDFDASGIKVKGGIADPNTLSEAMRTAIKDQNGGGAAAIVGNGNVVDNATNVSILGSKNSLKNTAKAQLLGDNRVVESADNSVIVGSADSELTTSKKNVTVLGYNANASVDGGVAVGSESLATVDKGVAGYDSKGEKHSADTTGTWKSTAAAVSVGNKEKNLTRQITNVAAGTEDTDAVNVAQLKAVASKVGSVMKLVAGDGISIVNKDGVYTISANIKGGSTPTDDVKVDPEKPGEGGNTSGATTDTPVTPVDPGNTGNTDNPGNTENPSNGNGLIITAETEPTNFSADSGEATAVKPGENLAIKGDTTNITTTASDHGITVSLKKDITVDSVTAGDTKMTSDGLTITGGPSITKSGIDAGGKKVTHVADGEIAAESKDAVNGSQLYRVQKNVESIENNVINLAGDVTNLSGRVSNLDNRINKVGAGAAALAALHPLDFNPDDKWNFAVGYGNYRNANSVALGAFYQPNENTMFNVATNFGNGENMINAGVSFKIGKGNSYAGVSKAQLVAENQQLKANDTLQDQKIQKQDQEIQELKKALEELKSRIK